MVKLIFKDSKGETQELHNEKKNEWCTENKDLQNSIEFCHNQTNDLKRHIDELQSAFSTLHDADLSDRVMKLEDYTKKTPYKWYCRADK